MSRNRGRAPAANQIGSEFRPTMGRPFSPGSLMALGGRVAFRWTGRKPLI